jgi:hypothetical protein
VQWVLISVVILSALYFIWARRRVDAFSVAFFSAVIYFLPGIAGYTLAPATPDVPIRLPMALAPEAITIMVAVTSSILFAGFLWNEFDKRQSAPGWVLEDSVLASWIAIALGSVGLVLTVFESDGLVFTGDKVAVMELIGRNHLLWQMGATIGTVLAHARKQRIVALAGWVLLCVDLWVGFRYAIATTFIAVVISRFGDSPPLRLGFVRVRVILLVLAGGLSFFLIKNLDEFIRAGDFGPVATRLSDPVWYANEILTSEPFTTQTILNEIVRRDFRTDFDHLTVTGYHLIVFSTELGREKVGFNAQFQPQLFPAVKSGLASNIWAQMWSAGGWPLLAAFGTVFLGGLAILSRLLRSADPSVRSYAAIAVAYWAFYLHRNELQVAVGSQKLLLGIWVGCVVSAIVLERVALALRSGVRTDSSARMTKSGAA